MSEGLDVVVIGGGVNGLAAAWNLVRLGVRRIVLLEQFRLGHERGSSHGSSRIARSAYPDAGYVRLMRRVFAEEWPRLERDARRTLVYRTPAFFFGPPDGPLAAYAKAVAEAGADVVRVPTERARRLAPQFRFEGADVLVDRTAGLVAARDVMESFAALVRGAGVDVREDTPVLEIEPSPGHVGVVTAHGVVRADRVVVTAGAWTSRLVPSLAPKLSAARQTIGYFALEGGSASERLGRFPIWCQMGRSLDEFHYGLPAFGRDGIKAARHVTSAKGEDPDASADPDPRALADLRAFLDRELAVRIDRLVGAETCLYTNTPTEDFVIGPLPDEPRIVVGSACSGHAFKFAPMTGRVLAELAVHGTTTVPEFEAMRATFAPPAPSGSPSR